MGVNSSTLCSVAKDMFYASMVTIPESFFCAQSVDDGKGDSEAINDAAEAWSDASQQLREFHDDFASVARSVPDSEWKAADREAYEQQINKYLEQVTTSATVAGLASRLLETVEAALYVYAAFALTEATIVAANAAAIAVADCTIVGAPEAEAEGLEAGTAAYEALETAGKVLMVALSGVAAAMEAGVLVDTSVQTAQGDSAALADLGHATVTGLTTDAKMLPDEAFDYAKGKLLKGAHDSAFSDSGGSTSDGGSDSGSGSRDSGGDGSEDGSGDGPKDSSGDGSKDGSQDDGSGDGSKDGSKDASGDGSKDASGDGSKDGSGQQGSDGHKDGSDDSKKDGSGESDDSKEKLKYAQPIGSEPIPKQIRELGPDLPGSG